MNLLKSLFLCLILCITNFCYAQNIIPNGSFEDTVQLKFGLLEARYWTSPNRESTNHYHPDANEAWRVPQNIVGFQYAHTGQSYIGTQIYRLYTYNRDLKREYLQAKLNRKLLLDSTYCFQIYVSLADSVHYSSRGQLGVYFSNQTVNSNDIYRLPYTPQIIVSPLDYISDKINWVKFDLQYKAQGGEEYITIGNFNDTTLLDTQFVSGGGKKNWYDITTYYIDDIWLSHCDSVPDSLISVQEVKFSEKISIYPNPVVNKLNIANKSNQNLQFKLYDLLGQVVAQQHRFTKIENAYTIDLAYLAKGIYILQVINGKETRSFKVLKE